MSDNRINKNQPVGDELHEECGVFGMYDFDGGDVASTIYYGLFALQHRGQEGAGIVAVDEGGIFRRIKGSGLVTEVFDEAIREAKGPGATPPFRGMSYNASAAQLVAMLNIGSISVKTE